MDKDLTQNANMVIKIIRRSRKMPIHIDAIASRANLNYPDTLVALLEAEFKGIVRQLPFKYFMLYV